MFWLWNEEFWKLVDRWASCMGVWCCMDLLCFLLSSGKNASDGKSCEAAEAAFS
jgi:hypothetical protein